MTENSKILERIAALSPREFENLVYDCVRGSGLSNLVWRTPGPDGGRDIEGELVETDVTGFETRLRWYVECKRYASSIDWPTVWQKLSYADSQGADVFLLATNSNPSPNCETEVLSWNQARRRPRIRFWRGYDLPRILRANLPIARAHGIIDPICGVASDGIDLSLVINRLVQASYSASIFDQNHLQTLETAAALSELLSQRLADLKVYGRFVSATKASDPPEFDWLTTDGDFREWEDVGLRALLCSIHLVSQGDMIRAVASGTLLRVRYEGEKVQPIDLETELLLTTLLWSRAEISAETNNEEMVIRQRASE